MFILKNRTMNSMEIVNALYELSQEKLPAKAAWNVTRTVKKLEQAVKDGREQYANILKRYVKFDGDRPALEMKEQVTGKNEDGTDKMGTVPTGKFIFLEGADEAAMKKEVEELLDLDVEVESHKIKLSELESNKVSAQLLMALEPIIEDDSVEEAPKKNHLKPVE